MYWFNFQQVFTTRSKTKPEKPAEKAAKFCKGEKGPEGFELFWVDYNIGMINSECFFYLMSFWFVTAEWYVLSILGPAFFYSLMVRKINK